MGTFLFTFLCYFAFVNSKTFLSIEKTNFYINGTITYSDCQDWTHTTKGLLLNSRMIQGVFDDANTSTTHYWLYPDTNKWNATRNTIEFIGNMSLWKSYGLLAFTVGLEGGGPGEGYPDPQPWIVSAFNYENGDLYPEYLDRLDMILQRADQLNMVPIIQFFYWGQAQRFNNKYFGLANFKVLQQYIN